MMGRRRTDSSSRTTSPTWVSGCTSACETRRSTTGTKRRKSHEDPDSDVAFDYPGDLRSRSDAERDHLMRALVVARARQHDDYVGSRSAGGEIRGCRSVSGSA